MVRDRPGRAAVLELLGARATGALELGVLGAGKSAAELAAALEISGIRATARTIDGGPLHLARTVDAEWEAGAVDLMLAANLPASLLLRHRWPCPVLLAPAPRSQRAEPAVALDIADVAADAERCRTRVLTTALSAALGPAAGLTLTIVSGGAVLARAETSPWGELEFATPPAAEWVGATREGAVDLLEAVEQRFAVLRPGPRPLVLCDAAASEATVRAASQAAGAGALLVAVRLRPTWTAASIRRRLERAGVTPYVIDARAVLDEGPALDVAQANDPVRLARVATRLTRAGFTVAGLMTRGGLALDPIPAAPGHATPGNRVDVELDNAQARRWLLELIAGARESIHLQVYMAIDDEIGRAVESALAEAADRGVTVRVLVDSLHGMYGSYGNHNSLLVRLSAHPGIDLRAWGPLRGVPTLAEVKRRDHRKLVIADGRLALVGGRNLAFEYYTGFDEVRLDRGTPWRQVPWLDAGARLEGPAVAILGEAFLQAWVDAGGEPFGVCRPAPCGETPVRVVAHHGLRDAHTLEAYLDLIDSARSHVYAVNGFPLALELQHAMLRALRRGVRVRVLSGHLTPSYDGTPFEGPLLAARNAATSFVHSRLDPLVEAGGQVHLFARRDAGGPGTVHTHVHAKLMSADGCRCVVGSANFDITSSYWESELALVVESAGVVQQLEQQVDALLAVSTRLNPEDPSWRKRAGRRAWMCRWPGVLWA